jgi:guanine nucleotide-binding protein subunit alpha
MSILDALTEYDTQHQHLISRLSPLRPIETDLKRQLGPGSEEVVKPTHSSASEDDSDTFPPRRRRVKEFSVNHWQDFLVESDCPTWSSNVSNATEAIASCRQDIRDLWADKHVQSLVASRRIELGDTTGL